MEQITMNKEFQQNIKTHRERLNELFKTFDLAVLGYDMQEQRCKDVYNRVLQEHEFYSKRDCERCEVKVGGRILDERFDFLLSDTDIKRLQTLAHPILVTEGITDEEGFLIEDWVKIKNDARMELVNFIILRILPQELQGAFWTVRHNIVRTDQLLEIMRKVA